MIDNENKADLEEIKRLIPHRYPFLLIDKVENILSAVFWLYLMKKYLVIQN